MPHTEVAIVGSGIVGLAMARAHARLGRQVTVFERSAAPLGATIRNFGMVWPIGQPSATYPRALRSGEIWQEVAAATGLWHNPEGSLHLAYHPDEWAVLEEFVDEQGGQSRGCRLLTPAQALAISPAVQPDGLRGAMYSPSELIVDPREAPAAVRQYLEATGKVSFRYQTAVTAVETGALVAAGQRWSCDNIELCSGMDLETLLPDTFRESDLVKVKLQMMRTRPQPGNWRMGPAIAGGLTLTHYAAFADCSSLPALQARIERDMPWMNAWGIHVMMSQNGQGECVIGDSHEYGPDHDPFLSEAINAYILDYLRQLVRIPDPAIASRWHGIYTKKSGHSEYVAAPLPGVRIVNGLSGAGMTLAFGLAEELVNT